MSESRLMQILASLARRSPLRTLHTICETQHQISTRKLEQYLEPIGDELAGFAFNLRQDYDALRKERDTLRTANQRLEGENGRLREALIEVTASLEWNAHGICRGINDGPIMPSAMAVDFAKATLAGTGEQQ